MVPDGTDFPSAEDGRLGECGDPCHGRGAAIIWRYFPWLRTRKRWCARATCCAMPGSLKRRLFVMTRRLRKAITLPTAHRGRAYVLAELKQYEEAIRSCGRVIALTPDDAATYNILGFTLTKLGYFAKR